MYTTLYCTVHTPLPDDKIQPVPLFLDKPTWNKQITSLFLTHQGSHSAKMAGCSALWFWIPTCCFPRPSWTKKRIIWVQFWNMYFVQEQHKYGWLAYLQSIAMNIHINKFYCYTNHIKSNTSCCFHMQSSSYHGHDFQYIANIFGFTCNPCGARMKTFHVVPSQQTSTAYKWVDLAFPWPMFEWETWPWLVGRMRQEEQYIPNDSCAVLLQGSPKHLVKHLQQVGTDTRTTENKTPTNDTFTWH